MNTDGLVEELTERVEATGEVDYLTLINGINLVNVISEFIVGSLIMIIITVIPLVISIEIAYISFPVLRKQLEKLSVNTKGFAQTIVKLTLKDANKALEEAATLQTGHSAMWTYLKIKMFWVFLSITIIVFVVAGGDSGVLTGLIYNLMSGLINAVVTAVSSVF